MKRVPSIRTCGPISLAIVMAASIGHAAAEMESSAARIAAICAACHRFDNKPNGIPPIVTLGEDQIIAMMRGFKARPRSSPSMHVTSRALSDAEIVAVAGYLSRVAEKPGR